MALTKYKLGDLIEPCEAKNRDLKYGIDDVRGISTGKEFIDTKANLDGVGLNTYKIVFPNEFAYVSDTSRRGDKMALALNKSNQGILISSIYTVFRVKDKEVLDSNYLFMYFNRPEFDRYSRFNSWGSARETFSWEDLCDIDIDLPDIEIQRKYVAIYNALLANQQSYERGLDDLKLVCDGYIEDLRKKYPCERIGKYIEEKNIKNRGNKIKEVRSVSVTKEFKLTNAKVNKNELSNYLVVQPKEIAFVQTTGNEKVLAFAYNNYDYPVVVSSVDKVFCSKDKNTLDLQYLSLFLSRKEFDRYARFNSWGSARETFTFDDMEEVEIPIPSPEIQKSIVSISQTLIERSGINKKLKDQIKDICPTLIKGSIEEGRKEE